MKVIKVLILIMAITMLIGCTNASTLKRSKFDDENVVYDFTTESPKVTVGMEIWENGKKKDDGSTVSLNLREKKGKIILSFDEEARYKIICGGESASINDDYKANAAVGIDEVDVLDKAYFYARSKSEVVEDPRECKDLTYYYYVKFGEK